METNAEAPQVEETEKPLTLDDFHIEEIDDVPAALVQYEAL